MSYSTLPLFSLQPETKEIPLTQGKVAIVDAADYEWLNQWKWSVSPDGRTFYARRTETSPEGKDVPVSMHRLIASAPRGVEVDHKDGNGLNNTRGNLRLATHSQNRHNSTMPSNNTSGFKGVSWHKRHRKWYAHATVNGKSKHIGHYDTPEDAARAYDAVVREIHGEFARPNFPLDGDKP